LFSWSYLFRSSLIAIRSPSLLLASLERKDVGAENHDRRIRKWLRIGRNYSESPKKFFGMQIYLNPQDLSPVSTSIGTDGILDLPLTCLLSKVLKKGMKVVDVGANLGYFSLLSAKLVGESGIVYAFEPEDLNFQYLSRSVALNNLQNIR
jgi:hypothetical protein